MIETKMKRIYTKTKNSTICAIAFSFATLSVVQSVKAQDYYLWTLSDGSLTGYFETDPTGTVIGTDILGGPGYFNNSDSVVTHSAFPSPTPGDGQNYADFYQDAFVAPNSDGNFDFEISIGYDPSQDALGIFDYDASSDVMNETTFTETDTPYMGTVTRTYVDPVPEPTILTLAGLSGLSLLTFRRQRK
jgi:hypothetical protein